MFANARRLLVVLLIACSGVILSQLPAHACRCVSSSVKQDVNRADVVFSGVLVDSSAGQAGKGDPQETIYRVEAETVYQGDLTRSLVEVTSAADSCGLGDLKADRPYLFFVVEDGADLATDRCSGTAPARAALVQQVERVTGPGTDVAPGAQGTPEEAVFTKVADAEPQELPRLAAPGVALVLLGLAGLFVVRRRSAD